MHLALVPSTPAAHPLAQHGPLRRPRWSVAAAAWGLMQPIVFMVGLLSPSPAQALVALETVTFAGMAVLTTRAGNG